MKTSRKQLSGMAKHMLMTLLLMMTAGSTLAQKFMEVFGCSQPATFRAIARFQNDGVVETVHYGLYRKLVNEPAITGFCPYGSR